MRGRIWNNLLREDLQTIRLYRKDYPRKSGLVAAAVCEAFAIGLFLLILMLTFGCTHLPASLTPKKFEPYWSPPIYRPDALDRCEFSRGTEVIRCGDDKMQTMVLLESSSLEELHSKFDRCESWR